ncbi:MAG: hypothetical protein K2X90_00065 [Candidatus Babeliaceae bacterium]|nr:hypothetical protein [Candidatus Babeliaceae bacterium]
MKSSRFLIILSIIMPLMTFCVEKKRVSFLETTSVDFHNTTKVFVPLKSDRAKAVRQVLQDVKEYVNSKDKIPDLESKDPFSNSDDEFSKKIELFKARHPEPPLDPWALRAKFTNNK